MLLTLPSATDTPLASRDKIADLIVLWCDNCRLRNRGEVSCPVLREWQVNHVVPLAWDLRNQVAVCSDFSPCNGRPSPLAAALL